MTNGQAVPNPSNENVESGVSESARPSEDAATLPASPPRDRKITIESTQHLRFAGPLPPPNILRGYDEIVPGAAERILTMAENQQSHRMHLESSVIEENCKSQRRGLNFGFVIAMTVILGGFFLIFKGKDITGIISVVLALVSLVGLFIYGKEKQSKQLKSNNKAFQEEDHPPTQT
jgi:uncharacterized membrane protein